MLIDNRSDFTRSVRQNCTQTYQGSVLVILRRHRRPFDYTFELLTGMESHHSAGRDRDHFASLGVTARTRGFVPYLEITETGQLDLYAIGQRIADLGKEGNHNN